MEVLQKSLKELEETIKILSTYLNKNTSLLPEEKKQVIKLFIQIDKIKRTIASNLFGNNGNKISARKRILNYLKENVGKIVTGDELAQVAAISEYARRIRELRHEHGGWQISTGMNRAGLKPDEYILENLEQRPEYARMNSKTWSEVLERDRYTCQNCGWQKGDPQTNSRKFLEIHHKNPVRQQGKPVSANLITLCNVCHDAREAEIHQ